MRKSKKNNTVAALKDAAIDAGLRGAGTIGGAAAVHTLGSKFKDKNPDSIFGKQRGAILTVIGIAATALLPDESMQKVAQGLSGYGLLQTAIDNMPESMKESVKLESGLSGIGSLEEVKIDWYALATEAETHAANSSVNGSGSYSPSYSQPAGRPAYSGSSRPTVNAAALA